MGLFIRRFAAVLGTVGLIATVGVYAASFAGLTIGPVTNARPWLFIVFGGFVLLYLPIVLVEYDGPRWERKFFWKGFAKTRPEWTISLVKTLGFFAIVHFAIFLLLTHGCSPEIANGSFVLKDHAIVWRTLNQSEYLSLKGWETRFFVSFMMLFYAMVALYWWFPSARRDQALDEI